MISRNAVITLAFLLVSVTLAWLFAGCSFPTFGLPPDTQGIACSDVAQCDDMNACTEESCTDGVCASTNRPDMSDSPAQIAGDCHKITCVGGKEEPVLDPTDVSADGNDCTIDSCDSDGVSKHTPLAVGSPCAQNGQDGLCNASGKCEIVCGPTLPACDDGKPCTVDTCDAATSICDFTPEPDGAPTPGAAQAPGDCHVHQCIGGVDTSSVDDTDVPVTTNDCVTPTCTQGAPTQPNKGLGVPCMTLGGKVCDGKGNCVECNVDGECPGATDDCQHPQCAANKCGMVHTPVNTPISAGLQTPGDCHVIVCDGNGGQTVKVDDNDTLDDGKDCTDDICTNGSLSHPDKPLNAPCGAGGLLFCDGMGSCFICNSDANCNAPQTCGPAACAMPHVCACCPLTCAQQSIFCGLATDQCGNTIQCNNSTKDNGETDVDCGGPSCSVKCAQGKKCAVDGDCASGACADGVCCDTPCNGVCQACTAAKKGSGQDGVCGSVNIGLDPDGDCADQGQMSCGTDGACDGAGACRFYATGSVCVPQTCASATTINVADTCTAAHTCMDNGTSSCGNYTCANNACKATCATDADCAGTAYCSAPTCLAKKANGAVCGGGHECQSNTCVDGVCCNTTCSGTCMACDVAGSLGTCSNVPGGQTDPGTCVAPNACNGSGGCVKTNGQPCGGGAECLSTSCADGVCCDTACNGVCQACTGAKKGSGQDGVCGDVGSGLDPDSDCADQGQMSCGTDGACDGAGACRFYATGSVCVPSSCADATTENAADTCTAAHTCMDNGKVPCGNYACSGNACKLSCAIDADCAATAYCSAPSCVPKHVNGVACAGDSECQSGDCIDGVCCNTTCLGTCMACDVAGSVGVCSNVPSGQPDMGTCAAPSVCNGAGSCLKPNGQPCGVGAECQSASCADGVCCNTACNGVCQACDVAGSVGVCSNIPINGTDMSPVCAGNQACDGNGACKSVNGQACASAGQCVSGFCPVDGVCCNTACNTTCVACGGGTCTNVAGGGADDTCMAPDKCDGSGHCQKPLGETCAQNIECGSGQCVDGYCCDSLCSGACRSCAVKSTEGKCTNIPVGGMDDNPACGGVGDPTHACSGGGACLLADGEVCGVPGDCASGNCAGGVCAP